MKRYVTKMINDILPGKHWEHLQRLTMLPLELVLTGQDFKCRCRCLSIFLPFVPEFCGLQGKAFFLKTL